MKHIKLFVSIFFILISTSQVFAQTEEPVNSNLLYENGISPKVLDMAASQFMQDGSFNNYVTITIEQNGETKTYDLEIIYDPEYQEGMDIRVITPTGSLTKKEKKELKRYIERSHYLSRSSRDYLYDEATLKTVHNSHGGAPGNIIGDESSLKVIKNNKDSLILEYFYQKKDIDPYLKNVKRLKGEIFIIDGKLDKVVLTNFKPLKKKLISYNKTVRFAKTDAGGYIINSINLSYKKKKKDGIIDITMKSQTTGYKNKSGKELNWSNKSNLTLQSGNLDTINVKLGGPLPLLGKQARKIGFELPRPIGVAAFTHIQSQQMNIIKLSVGINGGDMTDLENILAFDESDVKLNSNMYLAKADVWLFPFLNIMAIVGGGRNELIAKLKVSQELIDFINSMPGYIIDWPNLPEYLPVNSMLTTEIYGGGATLAGGVGDFNLSVNYQLMFTNTVEANTTNLVHIITPMAGYMAPFGLNIMAGAQGQFYQTELNGFFKLTDGNGMPFTLDYVIDFEPMKWNGIFGLYKSFSKHWEMSVQVGFGQRTSVTAIFGYRI